LILAAALAAGPALAVGLAVRVVAPDGLLDPTARVACLEPASEPVAIDAAGRAELPAGCRQARCVSQRWLPGEVVEGTCKLTPAAVLEIEMPQAARGEFAVRLEPKGGRGTPIEASLKLGEGARSPLVLPPVAPGDYVLNIQRAGSAWSCSSTPLARKPERVRVVVPWRDAVTQKGRVATPRGEAVPQVPLHAYAAAWTLPKYDAVGRWSCSSTTPTPLSASDGTFELQVDPLVETLVVAGGWEHPRGIAARSRQGGTAGVVNLVLQPARRVQATILDDKDVPLRCRALLTTSDPIDGLVALSVPGSVRQGTCGPDGRVLLGPLLSSTFELEINPVDALPARRRGQTAAGELTDLGVVRVERGLDVSVGVRSAEGRPVAGAEVSVRNRDGFIVQRTARTNAAGLATVRGLLRGVALDLRVRARDYATFEKASVEDEAGPLQIVLSKGSTVAGRVLTPDGGPASGAAVTGRREGDKAVASSRAEEDGTFALDVSPGPIAVSASATGFDDAEAVRIDVESGDSPDDIELTLRERGLVRGSVLDPEERPVSGATVLVLHWTAIADPPEIAAASTVSGADGGFSVPEPASGQAIVALVRGYSPGFVKYANGMRGTPVTLRLGPAAALRVRLPEALAETAWIDVRDSEGLSRDVRARSRSDFTIDDLRPGFARVGLSSGSDKDVTLVPGETTLVDFRGVGTVRGRVTRAGRGISRAVVLGIAREKVAGNAWTDDEGRFELKGLSAGPLRLIAQASEGRAEGRVQVLEGGEASVELELSEASLEVLVTDAKAGTPLPGAEVVAKMESATNCWGVGQVSQTTPDGGFSMTWAEAGCLQGASATDGRASFPVTTPGKYTLAVHQKDYESWTSVLELGREKVSVRAELVRTGPSRLRVVLETDPPGVEGKLFCTQGSHVKTVTPARGDGVCEGFRPGHAMIAFRAPGYGTAHAMIEALGRGTSEITLKVPRGGDLSIPLTSRDVRVFVVDAQKDEMVNQFFEAGWPECGFTNDAEGQLSYVCRGLPPGPYTIHLGTERRQVVIRPGETTVAY
jgi:carboxypeptidase family protein